jgi:hypothetical protein
MLDFKNMDPFMLGSVYMCSQTLHILMNSYLSSAFARCSAEVLFFLLGGTGVLYSGSCT